MSTKVTAMQPCIPTSFWPPAEVCYMFADSLEELHAMARVIGIFPFNFEDGPSPRYNLIRPMRDVAVEAGAVEMSEQEYGEMRVKMNAELVYSSNTGGTS